jgi:Na+-driven multidrug efflux pump
VKDPIGSAKSQEKIFKVALPVSLEAVFQTSLGFVDQIIVGTLGATAVAAVGLCNSISFIVMEVLQLCRPGVIGSLDAPSGLFGLRPVQVAPV